MTKELPVVFDWEVSSASGWGVYGLQIMLHWPGPALTARPPGEIWVATRQQRRRVEKLLNRSRDLHDQWEQIRGTTVSLPMPVLRTIANGLTGSRAVHGVDLYGCVTIGVPFLEDTFFPPDRIESLKRLALVVAGSTWNCRLLTVAGVSSVVTVIQGVDVDRFHPQPKTGWLSDRFKVFSGGKLEVRKGQDLALLAFRTFAKRHPDALLVTAWHSPWPELAEAFAANAAVDAPPMTKEGRPDMVAWAARLGIDPTQVLDIGAVPNSEMPRLLREMDVAVFPNRCEGGTNLVAMECLATGLPTILSANTGHLDLIERVPCYTLTRQAPVTITVKDCHGTEGWGESDVDEIIEQLEQTYTQNEAARQRGLCAAKAMAKLSWRRQIRELHRAVSAVA